MGPNGETIYPESPDDMARELRAFVRDFGVNVDRRVLRHDARAHRARSRARSTACARARPASSSPVQFVASAMTAVSLEQEPRPLLVGERINSQGSRKIKRLLLADDYDEIMLVAREQVEGGAHVLDVCVALTERKDEDAQMATSSRSSRNRRSAADDRLDRAQSDRSGAARSMPGAPIVNSINLENGRAKIDEVMPLVVEHGAAVVALTIDETGMAKTAERKLEIASRISDIVTEEYGMPPGALIFDALTFTLATGEPSSSSRRVETIEGIRLIKRELPGVLTSLGVSNVSFGLKPAARAALNSVSCTTASRPAWICALVNPKEIRPTPN